MKKQLIYLAGALGFASILAMAAQPACTFTTP